MVKKAKKLRYGYVVKRKARLSHICQGCSHLIKPGDEYYQVSQRTSHPFLIEYFTKHICEKCWKGEELKA